MLKVSFEKKNLYFALRMSVSCTTRNVMMSKSLIIQFLLCFLSNDRLREVHNKRNFKLLALKVVAVAYERWSFTRGSKYSDLT